MPVDINDCREQHQLHVCLPLESHTVSLSRLLLCFVGVVVEIIRYRNHHWNVYQSKPKFTPLSQHRDSDMEHQWCGRRGVMVRSKSFVVLHVSTAVMTCGDDGKEKKYLEILAK